jgi:molybdopterin/thiamine biosynthesis adenylyltransferase
VADDAGQALTRIHKALRARGFERAFQHRSQNVYQGILDATGLRIPVTVHINDFDFVDLPDIQISGDFDINRRLLPHLINSSRSLCYYNAGSIILDRYNPDGTIIQCLERAEMVVKDAIKGNLDADFAAEFRSYWESRWMLIDVPTNYVGTASLRFVDLSGNGPDVGVLSDKKSWASAYDKNTQRPLGEPEAAYVTESSSELTVDIEGVWPPTNLRECNTWLQKTNPRLLGKLEKTLVSSNTSSICLAIRAPNGTFGIRFQLPLRFRTVEFLKTRRKNLLGLIKSQCQDTPIERVTCVEAGHDYIYGRNIGSRRNLSRLHIVLIGCGTIGGFLAQQLAQCGAGSLGGSLTIFDPDELHTGNLGRHLLGVPFLFRNKAEACAEHLNSQLPNLDILPHPQKIQEHTNSLNKCDLVIDATGEEALSIALNQRAVLARPNSAPHLFTWLKGNGAIAQSLLTGETDKACLKCLKPELSGQPRFRTIRPTANLEVRTNHACGDAEYIPFPSSRSAAAASLACELALDWANKIPGHRFRSITFDQNQAFIIKDGSPDKTASCPACGVRS